jgi:thiamine kinase-like enzyme
MESRSGTNIIASVEKHINPDYTSPFVSANLESFGQPVRRLLFKLVAITNKMITFEPWAGRKKDTSTPDDFMNEVSIQQDIYTRTNYLGEALCPAIISAFIRIPNDSLVQNLLGSCVKYQFFVEEYVSMFEYHYDEVSKIHSSISNDKHMTMPNLNTLISPVEKTVESIRGTIETNSNAGYRLIDEIRNHKDILHRIDTVKIDKHSDMNSALKYMDEVKDILGSAYAVLSDVLEKVAINRDHLINLIQSMQSGQMQVGVIAMELLDGYDIYSTYHKMQNQLTQRVYLSSAHAFLRLCALGYRHNDLHHANMMVTKESGYASLQTKWPRTILIDFGRTSMIGSRVPAVATMNDINVFNVKELAKLFQTYFDNIPQQRYHEAGKDGVNENNTFALMRLPEAQMEKFLSKVITYMRIRQQTIMNNIIDDKYHNESGIFIRNHRFAPVQYKDTGKLLRSFTEVVCDMAHSNKRCLRVKRLNPSGIDLDILLLISAVIGKENISVYQYKELPLYNEIATMKLLPNQLHRLMDDVMDQLKNERDELKKRVEEIEAKGVPPKPVQPKPVSHKPEPPVVSQDVSEKKKASTPKRKSMTPPKREWKQVKEPTKEPEKKKSDEHGCTYVADSTRPCHVDNKTSIIDRRCVRSGTKRASCKQRNL